MKLYPLATAAAAALLLPACATVTRGTSQKFVILSSPPDAQVALSTSQSCVTPCRLKLKRKHGFTATFTKAGYAPLRAEVKSRLSGGGAAMTAGNVLIGGLIGAAVDGSSGALNSLTPNPLKVKLVESGAEAAGASPAAAAEPPAATVPDAAGAEKEEDPHPGLLPQAGEGEGAAGGG